MLAFVAMARGEESKVTLTPSGYASYSIGQVVQANPLTATGPVTTPEVNHTLFQQLFGGFNIQGSYNLLPITTNIGMEMKGFTEVPRSTQTMQDQGMASQFYYFFYLTRADMDFLFLKRLYLLYV
jgi:hypothetical protein